MHLSTGCACLDEATPLLS